jgi:hypothetical protein
MEKSMSKRVSYIVTDQNITVNYQGQTHIVKRTDPLAKGLLSALKENRLDDIPNLVSMARKMEQQSKGNVCVRDGELMVCGVKVPAALAHKIQKFMDEGLPYQPLLKFAENLQKNPSYRAVHELFGFLEKNDHPITETGNFIAYKRVKADFKDIHSGTFDNSPGQTLEMPRNLVNEDSTQTCSYGLHVANWQYAHTQFASHNAGTDIMLEVEVSPADVVAIPVDYNNAKIRVCKYKVLGVVDKEHSDDVNLRVVNPVADNDDDNDNDDADDAEDEKEYCDRCCSYDCDGDCYYEFCQECGEDVEYGYDLCEACEDEQDLGK